MALSACSRLARPGTLVMLKVATGTRSRIGSSFSNSTICVPPGPTIVLRPSPGVAPTAEHVAGLRVAAGLDELEAVEAGDPAGRLDRNTGRDRRRCSGCRRAR